MNKEMRENGIARATFQYAYKKKEKALENFYLRRFYREISTIFL